ncbi:MAG: non-canonical purine NTP pyrophosphatase [Gemmatimonadales bacterium]
MTPADLLVATRSAGKMLELAPMIEAAGFRPLSLREMMIAPSADEDAIEVFDSFEENALAKALYFRARSGGIAVLADDSGIAVEALGGAPGVRSKRWSAEASAEGDVPLSWSDPRSRAPVEAWPEPEFVGGMLTLDAANNRALLRALEGAPNRRAKYVCVAVIAWVDGEAIARGECAGIVLHAERGAGGFGYDPLFLSDELGKTFGEATREEKERVSHRGRAVHAALAEFARRR